MACAYVITRLKFTNTIELHFNSHIRTRCTYFTEYFAYSKCGQSTYVQNCLSTSVFSTSSYYV